jgi:hypothetical protein
MNTGIAATVLVKYWLRISNACQYVEIAVRGNDQELALLCRSGRLNRKLKIMKNFEPCTIDDGDELYSNGTFVFNITKMAEFIQNQNFACEEVTVSDYSRGSSKWKEDHVEMVDVAKPVIVAEISPGRYNVIDGNHRMEKARRLGLEKIQAYKLSPEQHLQFLTTEKGYRAYVEYWNDKLKENR